MRIITELTRGMTKSRKALFNANAKAFGREALYCLGGLVIFFFFFTLFVITMLYIKSLS